MSLPSCSVRLDRAEKSWEMERNWERRRQGVGKPRAGWGKGGMERWVTVNRMRYLGQVQPWTDALCRHPKSLALCIIAPFCNCC